jgi:hypothetical protein
MNEISMNVAVSRPGVKKLLTRPGRKCGDSGQAVFFSSFPARKKDRRAD